VGQRACRASPRPGLWPAEAVLSQVSNGKV
jgi:hypothetical protein